MNTTTVIDKLNDILRWEWKGVLQYTQASFLVHDVWREVYEPLFRKGADESLDHARQIGNKIVALGGMPVAEPAEVHQSTDLHELLHQALEVERGAVRLYGEALDLCQDDAPLRVLLEDIILEEQEGAEHLEKLLGTPELAGAQAARDETYARQPR
jgi:bacterioferritin